MLLKEHQLKIIDYHTEKELLLSNIYNLFAKRFPEYKEFWLSLSGEEREHAGWIKYFERHALEGKVHFFEGKTKTYTLITFIRYLDGIIEDIILGHYNTIGKAAYLALDLEKALLERKVFEQFSSYSYEEMRYLEILRDSMVNHYEKVKKFSDQIKENL